MRPWGAVLRELREEACMSQREMVALAGVNHTTLRRIERGTSPIPLDCAERILAVLGYELRGFRAPPRPPPAPDPVELKRPAGLPKAARGVARYPGRYPDPSRPARYRC